MLHKKFWDNILKNSKVGQKGSQSPLPWPLRIPKAQGILKTQFVFILSLDRVELVSGK